MQGEEPISRPLDNIQKLISQKCYSRLGETMKIFFNRMYNYSLFILLILLFIAILFFRFT